VPMYSKGENGGDFPARQVSGRRVPGQVVFCGWCHAEVPIPARGRVPKWCSSSCRHRAWEQARAAASGRAAVEVVERTVERVRPHPTVGGGHIQLGSRNAGDWVQVLDQLTQRLDTGLLYSRDLPTLRPAMERLVAAYNRRTDSRR
jgi:hypothetical protein